MFPGSRMNKGGTTVSTKHQKCFSRRRRCGGRSRAECATADKRFARKIRIGVANDESPTGNRMKILFCGKFVRAHAAPSASLMLVAALFVLSILALGSLALIRRFFANTSGVKRA